MIEKILDECLTALRRDRDRIDEAIAALEGLTTTPTMTLDAAPSKKVVMALKDPEVKRRGRPRRVASGVGRSDEHSTPPTSAIYCRVPTCSRSTKRPFKNAYGLSLHEERKHPERLNRRPEAPSPNSNRIEERSLMSSTLSGGSLAGI